MWVEMNQAYPKDDTPESLEGNAAHWVFEELLSNRVVCEGLIAPNGVVVTEEMIDGAELFVSTARARIPAGIKFYVEEKMQIPSIHKECFGTPDLWAAGQNTIEVIDYKFGHRFVDEFENMQGVAYVAGILDQLCKQLNLEYGEIDQKFKVNFTIVQPRCFSKGSPVRTWSFKASDIRGYINKLAAAAERALDPISKAVTNSECRDCPGRHACPALQEAAYSDAEFSTRSSPFELKPAAASLELKMLEHALGRLQSRVEGMREAVTVYIKQGHSVPWHKAEQSYGRTTWSVPVEQVLAMGEMFAVDLKKLGALTPGQAKKLGVDESVIKGYSITPSGSIKLIADNPSDARRVFGLTN
jgi:hypothetical protein